MSNIKSSPLATREVVAMIPGQLIGLWVGARLFKGMEVYQIVESLGGISVAGALFTLAFVILMLAGRVITRVTKQSLAARLLLSFVGAVLMGAGLAGLLRL